jgi:hypothetical protein
MLDSKTPVFEVGQTYTYPFFFRFPVGTGNTRAVQYKKNEDERWTIGPHELPPSFLQTSSIGSEVDANFAKIEYGVRAKLLCPGIGVVQGQRLQDLVVTEPILFVPTNPHTSVLGDITSLLKYIKSFSLQTSLLTGQPSSTIGFRQSMRDRFSSSAPRLSFETVLEIPDIVMSGSEFQFRVTLNVLSKTDNVSYIPPIAFVILRLDLKDITHIRAARDLEARTFRDGRHRDDKYVNMPAPDAPFKYQEHTDLCKQKIPLNTLPDSATLDLQDVQVPSDKKKESEIVSTCEAWFAARVPGFTPPSFRSFAISRMYVVKVKLGVELAGKRFEQEVVSNVKEMRSAAG